MCDTLLCIRRVFTYALKLYLYDSDIYVIVISDMCALYFGLFICRITCAMLIWFAFAFYSDANVLYFLYSCLFHILGVHYVGLGHISLTNSFVLIAKSLYEPSMLKTSTLFTYSRWYCHQSPKRGRLKASGPLVVFRWLKTIRDYYD